MLINIYGPIMRISFILTLIPGIMLVRSILRTLSLQIGDYILRNEDFALYDLNCDGKILAPPD